MILLSTAIFCGAILFVVVDGVARFFRLPVLAALSVALAVIVAFEAVVLNALSLFGMVRATPLWVVHGLVIAGWGGSCLLRQRGGGRWRLTRYLYAWRNLKHFPVLGSLIPLLIILALGAFLYPPNNYDSMSYHMARVVHWMQQQSVAYYPTSIDRQNVMGPGAEYLILVPQLLARSDILANGGQLVSYLSLIFATLFLLRLLPVSRELAPYIVILTVTAPMAIMQATSTQNDLVAAAMTSAMLISGRRLYLGGISRFAYRDFVLLGICLAAGFLVKPTSLLAAGPLLLLGVGRQLVRPAALRKSIGKCFLGGMVVMLMGSAVAGPDIIRKQIHQVSRDEVYPLFGKWGMERLQNPLAIAAHHIAVPERPGKLLGTLGYHGPFDNRGVFSIHEDLIGNPVQLMVFGTLATGTLLSFPAVIRRKKRLLPFSLSLAPSLAWIIFGLFVKDQPWISRLQLPLFYLLPFSFVYPFTLLKKIASIDKLVKALLIGSAFLALAYALVIAGTNPHRPIELGHFWGHAPDRPSASYKNALPEDRLSHQHLLEVARSQGCARVGLLLGGNSNEYPLIWQMIQEGREVRHTQLGQPSEDQDWPCLYYVESGQDQRLQDRGIRWRTVDGHTYARHLVGEFNQATATCLTVTFPEGWDRLATSAGNVSLAATADSATVRALDGDPQLFLPELAPSTSEWLVMEVVLFSRMPTVAQVYYKTKKLPVYVESQSFQQPLLEGENTLYFQIPGRELSGPVRFDPGQSPGDYELKSITVRPINR